MTISISVQTEDFDIGHEIDALTAEVGFAGAVASFIGLVRDEDKSLTAMTLEHYPGMTEKAISEIIDTAKQRWSMLGARVIHRIGRLLPGDRIVLVVVSSKHRGDAFTACEFIMDYLKTQAPFWKKEETQEGGRWVDARECDDVAADRWSENKDRAI
jgi:molybdopterin synthase catalytic subunit